MLVCALLGLIINTNYMRSIDWLLNPRGLQKPTGDAERRMMIVVDVLLSSVFCNQVLCGFVFPYFLFDIFFLFVARPTQF